MEGGRTIREVAASPSGRRRPAEMICATAVGHRRSALPTLRSRPPCAYTRTTAACFIGLSTLDPRLSTGPTVCPYSKATGGNIEVKLLANGKPVESGAK